MVAQSLTFNVVHHACTKHNEIDMHFILDLVATSQLEIRYVPTAHQPIDIITLSLARYSFFFFFVTSSVSGHPGSA